MTRRFEVSRATCGAGGIRDILQRQLTAAVNELPRGKAGDEEIHRARKRMKAARATLRLLRPLLGEAAYRRENALLRDAGRALSAARDDTVLVQTLAELAGKTRGAKQQDLAEFQTQLRRDAGRRRVALEQRGLRQSAARLRTALDMIERWRAPPADWKPVYRSLRESYRKGRRCARSNARCADGATLHEWRKRAKYLRSQLEVIAPVQHASVEAMTAQLHKLADHLGDEHDLAVLAGLAQRRRAHLGRKAQAALQKRIDRKRRALCKRALRVGLPLYAEKPAHFSARLKHYFREWS